MSPLASLMAAITVSSAVGLAGETVAESFDGEGTRHLTGLVTAHAVGDGVDAFVDEVAVLVLGADLSRMGHRTPPNPRHYCASSTV